MRSSAPLAALKIGMAASNSSLTCLALATMWQPKMWYLPLTFTAATVVPPDSPRNTLLSNMCRIIVVLAGSASSSTFYIS